MYSYILQTGKHMLPHNAITYNYAIIPIISTKLTVFWLQKLILPQHHNNFNDVFFLIILQRL
jgi:hypothetical protein